MAAQKSSAATSGPATDVSAVVAERTSSILDEWREDPTRYTPEEVVRMIREAETHAAAGEELGTVRRDPTTGYVYVRGATQWRVVNPEQLDVMMYDERASLPFPALREEEPADPSGDGGGGGTVAL